jgi:ribosomal protein S18 acetylase RimI-like enzyme
VADTVRSFRGEDRDAVVELSRRALARPEEHVGNPIWSTRDDLETELADWDPVPEETLVVAEEAGRVIGFAGVELPRGFDHAELFGPLVASDFQGQRVGSRLLEAATELARTHGASALIGSVGTRNATARILLERNGFRSRGTPQATYRLKESDHRPVVDPPTGVHVRRAGPDDLPSALALYHECFPEGRFPDDVWREDVARGTVYAAETGGRVVAVLNIDPNDRWIYHVGVTESERDRRIGSYLLSRSLEDYWRQHPGDVLGLDITADNVPAIRLYRRQGFAPWLVLQAYELALATSSS